MLNRHVLNHQGYLSKVVALTTKNHFARLSHALAKFSGLACSRALEELF